MMATYYKLKCNRNSVLVSGKLQTNYVDSGFRQLNTQLGRWHCDKLAEMYSSVSPYAYVLNNPINMYDIAGLKPDNSFNWWVGSMADGNGNLTGGGGNLSDFIHGGWQL